VTEFERDFTFSLTKYPSLIFVFLVVEGFESSSLEYLSRNNYKVFKCAGRIQGQIVVDYKKNDLDVQ